MNPTPEQEQPATPTITTENTLPGQDLHTAQAATSPEDNQPIQPMPAPSGVINQPAQSFQTPVAPAKHSTDAGLVVLQWLTYAFWGWTVLGLSILTGTVLANFISDTNTGGFTPYGIAAVLVLLPISFICDIFYSKKEPQKKKGAEMLVMVLHAVLFALFGIGSLIIGVISIVELLTNSGDTSSIQVALYSAMIITIYYGLTFLRTLNPASTPWIKRFYKFAMLATVGIIVILGIVGPLAEERTLRNDKLIESNLTDVQSAINDYTHSKNELPTSLGQIKVEGDAQQLIDKHLVTFIPGGASTDTTETVATRFIATTPSAAFKYQLCVNYTKESEGYSRRYTDTSSYTSDGYSSYISPYMHTKGKVCYKIMTTDY